MSIKPRTRRTDGEVTGEAAAAQPSVLDRRNVGGAAWVAAGLAVLGAAGYVFLTVTARVTSAADYATLASLYLLISVVGTGLFSAFDLEISRLVSRFAATGAEAGTVMRQLGILCAGVLAGLFLVLGALSPVLVGRIFNGNWYLFLGLAAAAAGYALFAFPRGLLAGRRQLHRYAGTIAAEGFARLLPCLVLAGIGVTAASAYGLALGLGPLVAAALCWPWAITRGSGPRVPWGELARATGWLLASSLLALALANLAPVVVKALLTGDPARAGVFAFAFVLTRIPHFVFVSLQTILLPAFTHSATKGDAVGLRRAIKQAVVTVIAFGSLAGAVLVLLTPKVIDIIFGAGKAPSYQVLIYLTLANVALMLVGQVLQPAMLSVSGHRMVAIAWSAGAAVFAGALLLPIDPIAAALVAQSTGVTASGILLIYGLRSIFRDHSPVTSGLRGGHG